MLNVGTDPAVDTVSPVLVISPLEIVPMLVKLPDELISNVPAPVPEAGLL